MPSRSSMDNFPYTSSLTVITGASPHAPIQRQDSNENLPSSYTGNFSVLNSGITDGIIGIAFRTASTGVTS